MKVILASLFIFISLFVYSQDQTISSGYLSQEKKIQYDIVNNLEPIFQSNPSNDLALRLGDALLYLKKYKKAISYYEYVLDNDKLDEKQTFNYFTSLFEFGDTRLAMEVAKDYYIKFGKMNLKSKVDSFEKLRKATPIFFENYLAMNSKNNEFGLYPLFADYRIFNTDQVKVLEDEKIKTSTKKNIIKPYVFSLIDMDNEAPDLKRLQADNLSTYSLSHYDEKEKKVYLTSNSSSKFSLSFGGPTTMKIYTANIDPHFKLYNITEFKYNNPNFSVGQACMTRDGMNLYFVSDMPGGYGGTDIYRCMKLEDGSWGAPINLGNVINTENNEMYPYISPKGNTLYFSSNGHSIFGGLDINKSQKTRYNTFAKPINLGLPFNSNKDDFAVVFMDDIGNEGFFSSNRAEGVGGVDIYHFKYDQSIESAPTSTASASNSSSGPQRITKVIEGKVASEDDDVIDFHNKNNNSDLPKNSEANETSTQKIDNDTDSTKKTPETTTDKNQNTGDNELNFSNK
jgi:tetratricopeptide (TPR) repeat protein